MLKPTKFVIGGPGSGSGTHVIIEAHATFKTSEAVAAAAAEDGRGPAQRKGGFEVRATRTPKAQAKVNAAIAQAFQAKAQRGLGGGDARASSASRAAASPQNGGCAVPKAGGAARQPPPPPVVKAESPATAAVRAGAVSLPAVAPAPVVVQAEASIRAPTADAEAARPSGMQREVKPSAGAAPAARAGVDAAPRHSRAVPDPVVAASVMSVQAGGGRDQDRRNGSRAGLPPLQQPPPQVSGGALEHLAMGNARTAGMWGALGDMLGQATNAAPAAVNSSSGLGQLLAGAGVGGLGQLGYSSGIVTPHVETPGMSAAQSQLLGALGGGFGGLAFSAGPPAASAPAPVPQAPAAAPAAGITAAEQQVIDALRAQAQLRTVQEAAAPAAPAPHPLLSQQGAVWPEGTAWGGAASAGMAAAAAARVSTPPPTEAAGRPDGVNPSESISPQHMELLAALLNGQDVRSHPGYQSLRQALLGNRQQLTYDDLLRQRWSGQ